MFVNSIKLFRLISKNIKGSFMITACIPNRYCLRPWICPTYWLHFEKKAESLIIFLLCVIYAVMTGKEFPVACRFPSQRAGDVEIWWPRDTYMRQWAKPSLVKINLINADLLPIGPKRTKFNEILIGTLTFSFKKMCFKMSSGKGRPFVPASMC